MATGSRSQSPCPTQNSTQSPPTPTYSFDLLFFRRILNLHKILFPRFVSVNVGLFVSLLAVSTENLQHQLLCWKISNKLIYPRDAQFFT